MCVSIGGFFLCVCVCECMCVYVYEYTLFLCFVFCYLCVCVYVCAHACELGRVYGGMGGTATRIMTVCLLVGRTAVTHWNHATKSTPSDPVRRPQYTRWEEKAYPRQRLTIVCRMPCVCMGSVC